jgi:hypothetical protein
MLVMGVLRMVNSMRRVVRLNDGVRMIMGRKKSGIDYKARVKACRYGGQRDEIKNDKMYDIDIWLKSGIKMQIWDGRWERPALFRISGGNRHG